MGKYSYQEDINKITEEYNSISRGRRFFSYFDFFRLGKTSKKRDELKACEKVGEFLPYLDFLNVKSNTKLKEKEKAKEKEKLEKVKEEANKSLSTNFEEEKGFTSKKKEVEEDTPESSEEKPKNKSKETINKPYNNERLFDLNKEYGEISGFRRGLSHILPNFMTRAGRIRNELKEVRSNMDFGSYEFQDYNKDYSYLDNPSLSRVEKINKACQNRSYDKAVDVYANLYERYKSQSRFMRFLSYITPNSWTQAGRLKMDVRKCKKALTKNGLKPDYVDTIRNFKHHLKHNELKESKFKSDNFDKAVDVYNKAKEDYSKHNWFARTFSHFLPDRYTQTGRDRDRVNRIETVFRQEGYKQSDINEYEQFKQQNPLNNQEIELEDIRLNENNYVNDDRIINDERSSDMSKDSTKVIYPNESQINRNDENINNNEMNEDNIVQDSNNILNNVNFEMDNNNQMDNNINQNIGEMNNQEEQIQEETIEEIKEDSGVNQNNNVEENKTEETIEEIKEEEPNLDKKDESIQQDNGLLDRVNNASNNVLENNFNPALSNNQGLNDNDIKFNENEIKIEQGSSNQNIDNGDNNEPNYENIDNVDEKDRKSIYLSSVDERNDLQQTRFIDQNELANILKQYGMENENNLSDN